MANETMVNDRREINGWAMYDWANSAFSTTVGTVFLGPYVAGLARSAAEAMGSETVSFLGIPVAPDSFLPYCISLSVGLQVLFLPILGAIADYSHLRKAMMRLFATIGAIATILLFFVTGNLWWLGGVLYMLANLSFGAAIVFYNAYLPDIASEEERDRVSSYGWAMGYLGGGILLALNLAFFIFSEDLGVPADLAVRINLASAGLWWLGFSFITWSRLRSRKAARALPAGETYVSIGFKQLKKTVGEVKKFPETLKFLLAYFLYNDGIQTVIAVSSTFAAAPLIQGGLELPQDTLIAVILMIQFVAFGGALFWGKLAQWIGAKQAIIVSLVIWSGVVIYAYSGMKGPSATTEFFILGMFIAIVLGGSQAISRSLFAQMIPNGKEAEFFSFYEISERGTSWIGPLVFGLANQMFGNLRFAILSLIFFFILGLLLLPRVNVSKAIADAKITRQINKKRHAQ
ncbi:MAG: putative major facilitator superfamily transporter [Chloroflexi bacterium OLB14]|nr:MAG: putative major facilitator superfamily transporter [Chloroflexi bacterium OLB14]